MEKRSHRLNDGFKNINPAFTEPSEWQRLKFIASRIWSTTLHPRTSPLIPIENDGALLRSNETTPTVTWIGHATLLIQLDGLNILTDPHWSDRASPVTFAGPKRLVPPGLRFDDLPPIHLVLISHDHYDHLDLETVRLLEQRHRPQFLVPLGLKEWLDRVGIRNVEEFDWWDTRKVQDCVVIVRQSSTSQAEPFGIAIDAYGRGGACREHGGTFSSRGIPATIRNCLRKSAGGSAPSILPPFRLAPIYRLT